MKLWHWIGLFLFVIWVGSSYAPDDPPKRSSSSSDRSNATSPASDPTPSTSASQPAKIRLYVTGNVVNVRSGPGTSYARVTQLKRSDEVQEISRQNGWVEISFRGGRGWMFGKYLSPTRPKAPSPPPPPPPPVKKAPQQRRCHPSYSGACVPIASDVDCAGGSGNGPAYVRGPVRVIGRDVYGLDRDKDGIGCE